MRLGWHLGVVTLCLAALALAPAFVNPGLLFLVGLTMVQAVFALSWSLLFRYAGLASFGLPVLLLYGVVKGLGGSMPQFLLTQFAGALFGRYVMARRFGDQRWREYAVVLYAGYACGAGLLMMLATGSAETAMSAENSDVLPAGSVVVAVTHCPPGTFTGRVTEKLALPLSSRALS